MNTRTLTAVALILAAIPVAGFAQNAAPVRPAMPTLDFAAADADGSGGISAEEWTAYTTTLRTDMRSERMAAQADALIAAADADGDGALNRDELITGMTAMHESRGDRMGGMMGHHQGGRGDAARGERREMRGEGHGGRHGARDGQMRREGGMRGEGRGPGGMRDGGFARIDANGDGQIDAEELAQAQAFMTWMSQRPGRN